MARKISYERQTLESRNPAKRFAHQARLRRAADLAIEYLPKNGSLLDFGAGPVKLLNDVQHRRPDVRARGYDKFMTPRFEGIEYVARLDALPSGSVDVMTAFEVMEHLTDEGVQALLDEARRLLTGAGCLIVSVPIVYGPITLVKEASQMVAFRRGLDYSVPELCRVVVGLPIGRPMDPAQCKEGYLKTHKGFDFRQLRSTIAEAFTIERELLSPFPGLSWIVNSQIFFVARPRRPQ
jgi:SAM-dependent methyltransferase